MTVKVGVLVHVGPSSKVDQITSVLKASGYDVVECQGERVQTLEIKTAVSPYAQAKIEQDKPWNKRNRRKFGGMQKGQ